MLLVACGACLLAMALEERADGRVSLRGRSHLPLPETCAVRTLLGVKCPGCGLTRAIIRLARADWQGSFHQHRLGGLFALLIVLQVPYRLLALSRPEFPFLSSRWQTALGFAVATLLLANWVVELAAGRLILTH
jgi:hypothetical protein